MPWKLFFCFCLSLFFFFAVSKELAPNVYIISNQHPFYVRWGDKSCNYREAETCDSAISPRGLDQRCRAWGTTAGMKEAAGRGDRWKNGVSVLAASIPFALPQNISFFWFSMKNGS